MENGHADQAQELLDEIGPWFPQLRFYPVPHPMPLLSASVVHLQTAGVTVSQLRAVRPSPRVLRMKESLHVWAPRYDRLVELFLETVEGPIPTLTVDADGKVLRGPSGAFLVEGGWPCRRFPDDWHQRGRLFLEEEGRLRKQFPPSKRYCGSKSGYSILCESLAECLAAAEPSEKVARRVRLVLAGIATRRGVPGGERGVARRLGQARQLAAPTTADLACVAVARLEAAPADQGLPSVDEALAPVSAAEATRFGVPAGCALPAAVTVKIQRCLDAPVEVLVERGVVSSAEVLAVVLPQMTAQVRAAGLTEPSLQRLYGALYGAFRRRRSLLLLNLKAQAQLEELPWARAIERYRSRNVGARVQAREVLEQLVVLAYTAFPQQIMPNKLLQEVRSLVKAAELDLPLVEEVAADIFLGEFSEKFLLAARRAAALLEGSLYDRYYGSVFARLRSIRDVKSSRWGTRTSPAFAALCRDLAGEAGRGWSVAGNGKIIEQEQILTTHNLAVLFDGLGLIDVFRPRLESMAQNCFRWICKRLVNLGGPWKARLQAVKNAAYAWRQMIFFLTLLTEREVESFLGWVNTELDKHGETQAARFRPALEGLRRAARGLPVEDGGGRRFLGWTTETHWLLQ